MDNNQLNSSFNQNNQFNNTDPTSNVNNNLNQTNINFNNTMEANSVPTNNVVNQLDNNQFQTGFNNTPASKYKLVLNRPKNFVGSLVAFNVSIDNVQVGKIKNGESLTLEVTPGEHNISIHNCRPKSINITGDTTADVAIFGANDFGIDNINGSGQTINNDDNTGLISKYEKQANTILYGIIATVIISVIMLFTLRFVVSFLFYAFEIGYGIININALKKIKNTDQGKYKSILSKNVISIIIAAIAMVLTLLMTA